MIDIHNPQVRIAAASIMRAEDDLRRAAKVLRLARDKAERHADRAALRKAASSMDCALVAMTAVRGHLDLPRRD